MNKLKYIAALSIIFFTILYAQSLNEHTMDCDAGSAEACFEAAEIYSAQAYKEKNYDKTMAASKVAAFYKRSCHLGYAKGCTAYALIYTADKEKDPHKDMRYYLQKACNEGDDIGCSTLKMIPEGM